MGSISTGIEKDNNFQYDMNIYLEKMNFFPGETINGLIQLTSNNQINKKFISSLRICFILKGIEYWQNKGDNKISNQETPTPSPDDIEQKEEDNYYDKKHYFERNFISKEEIISNLMNSFNTTDNNPNNNNINKKEEIKFPIQLEIPKDIKSSFEWSKENNIYCFSRIILSINIPELKLFSNYFLFIHKSSPSSISPINENKIIGKKSVIFFWDNDNIKIEATSERDSYSFYDLLPFKITIDTSELKSKLNSINLTLKRKIKYMVNGEQSIFLNTCDFIDDLWEQKIILEKNETNHVYEFKIPLIDKDKVLNHKKDCFSFEIKNFNKKFLTYLIPSYAGEMIKCEYFIKIKPIFEGLTFAYNDFLVFFDLFHNINSFNAPAIKEIDKILFEINKMKIVNYNNKDNNNICSVFSSSLNQSLPDEDMIRQYYMSNRGSPPVRVDK